MPQTLGRYILERTIAVGGMGEVFHARQTGPDGFDRTCVVKTMHPSLASDPELVEMFLEEARLTARLTHPHIAQVYDFGKIDSAYYIAMELVDGPSLHGVVKAYATRAAKLPLAPALRMVSQAAQALDYVHKLKGADGEPLKLVHRDISPGNLLLSRDGLVKLIDFGIAKARTTARQTRMGQIRGKLAYMSPEQMLGQPLDGRTDIYSLGLVLYEMLTSRRANPGRNEVEIMTSARTGALQPLASVRSDCPGSIEKLLERAVARDRDRRFQRAGEFSHALEQAIVELGTAVDPEELAKVAEEVALTSPRPSPAGPKPPQTARRPLAATVADAPRGAATAVQVDLDTTSGKQAPVTKPARERSLNVLLAVLGAGLIVLGGAAGALWAFLSREAPKPVQVVVVAAPPPAVKPPAVEVEKPEPLESPAPAEERPEPVIVEARTAKPLKSRWQKGEKFAKAETPTAAAEPPAAEPALAPAPAEPALALAPAANGAVKVTSDPPTEIYVDGKAAGVTPTTLQLPTGAHQVELREPRLHLSWAKNIDVDGASPVTLTWRPSHGTIDVRPVPPHVELQISVDGVAVGPTPISAFSVWEGQRKISVFNSATGWRTEKTVDVPPNGRMRIKVNDGNGMEVTR